ncbi:amidohydrolase family protein [Granulicella cerasi]|uniref:Amidohydrolase family protein n=1 Tax=Granulicella cerasi TaxID=741063 RepID=A0ABW1ZAU1_9BACT|nr:amidohydrolase family protein [Granulicella cerasi]
MTAPKNSGLTRRDFLTASALAAVAVAPAVSRAEVLGALAPPTNCDLLIMGCDIVTFDDKDTVIADGAIAVKGNQIVWLGKASDAATMYSAKETLKADGLIAMPGMTDTHYHTAQQFLRGVHRTTRRKGPGWKKTLIPFESGLQAEDVYNSGLVGYTSMISSGTTCFLEAGGPHPDEMGRAAMEVGIRGRISLNTCDMDGEGGALPKSHIMTTSQALKENEALVKRWKNNDRVSAWLSLRQIVVNTEELRINMSHLAEELDVTIHTHLSEGTYEVDYTVENYNCRPPEYFAKIGIFNKRMHCAHSVLLTPSDVDLYAKHDASVAHCAFHNYYLAPHRMLDMMRQGIRVGLGSDGPGSRGTLDLFQVSHYAVMGQTIGYGMPFHASSPISYAAMLKQACRGGAAASHLGTKTGSLELGKLADIVLVGHDDYDQFTSMDPQITLGQNCVGHHVRHTIVDGKIVMKNREFLTLDVAKMRASVKERYPRIISNYEKAIAVTQGG